MAHDMVLQKPTTTVCFYVRPRHADTEYYRAIYLKERTMRALINGISEKFKVGLASIGPITYHDSRSVQVVIDEDVLNRVEDGQNMAVDFMSTEHSHQSRLVRPLFNIVRDDANPHRPDSSTPASLQLGEDMYLDEFSDFVALYTEEDMSEYYSEYTSKAKEIELASDSLHNAEALINSPQDIRTATSGSTRSTSDPSLRPQSEAANAENIGTPARSSKKPKKSESSLMHSSLTVNTRFLPQTGKSPSVASVAFPPTNRYVDPFFSMECNQDDFGFDPPTSTSSYSTFDLSSRSKNRNDMATPAAQHNSVIKGESTGHTSSEFGIKPYALNVSRALDNTQTKDPSSGSTTVSGFGLGDLPSSFSMSTIKPVKELDFPSDVAVLMRENKTNTQNRNPSQPFTTTKSVRKGKKPRKSVSSVTDSPRVTEDKRKVSLEKNRIAAATCRINKREKIEQMQDDSRKKAVQNTLLKNTTMHLKEEIEYMNHLLSVHSDCKDCDNPNEIQEYLQINEHQKPLASQWPAP